MWIFDRNVWREKNTSIPPLSLTRDQKVNLSKYKKIEIVSSCMLIN